MSSFIIQGGLPLNGNIRVHGAKNSVLPILSATLLNRGKNVITNCPYISDVDSSVRILNHLGCQVERQNDAIIVDSSTMSHFDIPDCLMREMRSSVVFLGAILARSGKAVMSFPGGCDIGTRHIDLHLQALRELGANISESNGNIFCEADVIVGKEINLTFPSVGATENILLTACTGKGVTRITNAAREPEIEDLANFLNAMGCKVIGAGTSTISIEGVNIDTLRGVEHKIIPDRIVASTYLCATAVAGGDVWVEDVIPSHLSTVISLMTEAGCEIDTRDDRVHIVRKAPLKAMRPMKTQPYPGFPTDAQATVMSVATCAEGTTVFVENIFESRFRHVGELARMGADIKVEGRVAVVCGVPKLFGAQVHSTDLRGGAALVVAALGARGQTKVGDLHHIDRGYEKLHLALSSLGADMKRV